VTRAIAVERVREGEDPVDVSASYGFNRTTNYQNAGVAQIARCQALAGQDCVQGALQYRGGQVHFQGRAWGLWDSYRSLLQPRIDFVHQL
jgi:hypothetical protein